MVLGLVAVNVASNRVVGHGWYVPLAVATSVALVVFARTVGQRSWADLGMAREQVGSGLRWGGVLCGAVVVVYLVGVALPATRDLFRDDRVADMTWWQPWYAAFVRVPLGTVLVEEVAFRAVVPAVLATRMRPAKAIGIAAVLFGLWHVLPSLGLESVNPVAQDTVGRLPGWVTVAGSVGSTALVSLWFAFLKERSGSILTPMIAHWSTNALGYLFAYAVLHW